jgi:NAD(P)-dependent dehydrogenase (short-subunit alcohol dehydrogenase family)
MTLDDAGANTLASGAGLADPQAVWFVTGCSAGLGQAIASHVLGLGGRVVATARDTAAIAWAARHGERALALPLDVTRPAQIDAAVRAAIAHHGRIDVLVNNAGYGYQSSVEEADEHEVRQQFDANVFGLFAVTRAVLPGLRSRRYGHVFNVTSVAGLVGMPGSAYYAASKHAVEGFTDALAAEVGPLGIGVTAVEPGPFRTDWAGRSLHQTPCRIADYAGTVGARLQRTQQGDGRQAGDPQRAAAALVAVALRPDAPRHLVLGKAGHRVVVDTLRRRLAEVEQGAARAAAADFDAA